MEKMLISESHENFTNVGFYISTIREIEPNNLSLFTFIKLEKTSIANLWKTISQNRTKNLT